jgi:hypothetical protein
MSRKVGRVWLDSEWRKAQVQGVPMVAGAYQALLEACLRELKDYPHLLLSSEPQRSAAFHPGGSLVSFSIRRCKRIAMASEEITFRKPDFGGEESRHSDIGPFGSDDVGHDQVVFREPNFDGEHEHERPRPEHALTEGTDVAPKATTSYATELNGANGDADALYNRNSDNSSDSQAKNDTGVQKVSLGLAPTQSIAEGEAHKVVKKRTYLHKKHSERVRRHTFLAKCLGVGQNIWIMVSTFPYWDMAFWSG